MRQPLPFTKMHGLGNDFMVLDCTRQTEDLDVAQIRLMADRHLGVGFDQLLMVESSPDPDVDFRFRIFNADGSEVEQCGNGARCVARFVHERGLSDKDHIRAETAGGVVDLRITPGDRVVVDMGLPRFLPAEIPFVADATQELYLLEARGESVELAVVNMGNPHAVLFVDAVATAAVNTLGPLLVAHPRFPVGANVGFMQVLSRDRIKLRVFERGAGETLACGTGACAAVVTGRRRGLLDARVCVDLPGGELCVEWRGRDAPVLMEGPATRVYEGLWIWP